MISTNHNPRWTRDITRFAPYAPAYQPAMQEIREDRELLSKRIGREQIWPISFWPPANLGAAAEEPSDTKRKTALIGAGLIVAGLIGWAVIRVRRLTRVSRNGLSGTRAKTRARARVTPAQRAQFQSLVDEDPEAMAVAEDYLLEQGLKLSDVMQVPLTYYCNHDDSYLKGEPWSCRTKEGDFGELTYGRTKEQAARRLKAVIRKYTLCVTTPKQKNICLDAAVHKRVSSGREWGADVRWTHRPANAAEASSKYLWDARLPTFKVGNAVGVSLLWELARQRGAKTLIPKELFKQALSETAKRPTLFGRSRHRKQLGNEQLPLPMDLGPREPSADEMYAIAEDALHEYAQFKKLHQEKTPEGIAKLHRYKAVLKEIRTKYPDAEPPESYTKLYKKVTAPTQTYTAARQDILRNLTINNWHVNAQLKVPYATSPNGLLRLWFKPQAVYLTRVDPGERHEYRNALTMSYTLDIRRYTGDEFRQMIEKSYAKTIRR